MFNILNKVKGISEGSMEGRKRKRDGVIGMRLM